MGVEADPEPVKRQPTAARGRVGTGSRPRFVDLGRADECARPGGVIELCRIIAGRAQRGAAVFVSSHHLHEVARLASIISVMHDGRIVGTLPPDGVDLERQFFRTVEAASSRVSR